MDSMYLPTQGAVGIVSLLASLVGQLYFTKEKYGSCETSSPSYISQ